MKKADMKNLSSEEIAQHVREMQAELTTLRLKHKSTDGIESPRRLAVLRKEIAQLKTFANQKKAVKE